MSIDTKQMFTRKLRNVLETRFNMPELAGIAMDVDVGLYNQLTHHQDLKAYSTALVDHCVRHGMLPMLSAVTMDKNSAAYNDLRNHIPGMPDFQSALISKLRTINPDHAFLKEIDAFGHSHETQERRDLIVDSVARQRSSIPGTPRIFAIWGSPGCGKTRLMYRIAQEWRHSCRSVDFRQLEHQDIHDETTLRCQICQVMRCGQFNYRVGEDPPINRLSALTVDELANEQPVICLDNIDYLLYDHEDTFLWFESNILAPTLARQPLTVIVTQTARVAWTNSALSRLSQHCQLVPYTDTYVDPQLADNIPAEFSFRATYGHPPTIDKLIESVVSVQFTYSDSTVEQQEELIRSMHAWAKNYIVQRCSPQHLSDVLVLLCPLRWFTIELLKTIIRQQERQIDRSETQELVHQLTRQGWVIWDRDWLMYRFSDCSVRRLLSDEMQCSGLSRYMAINEVAFSYFADGLRYVGNLEKMLPEALFHLACQMSIKHNKRRHEIARECKDWLEKRSELAGQQWDTNAWYNITRSLDFDEIHRSAIAGNKDPCEQDVLVRLDNLNELRMLTGPNGYNDILDFARSGATIR